MNVEAGKPETFSAARSRVEAASGDGLSEATERARVETSREMTGLEEGRAASRLPVWMRDARLLLIAVWLGGAVFFSFAVAPSAFAVLPSRELAGKIVSRTLGIVNTGGFLISLLLLASAFVARRAVRRRAFYMELCALALVAITTAAGQWIISARLTALRLAMGRPIDEIAQNDPLRVAFNSLHGYSVLALGIGMLAAVAALLLIARRKNTV